MALKTLSIALFLFLSFSLIGWQTKNIQDITNIEPTNKINKEDNTNKILNENKDLTPKQIIANNESCEKDLDCELVIDPYDFCCGSYYSMNRKGREEYKNYFAEAFNEKEILCDKEDERGLSCSKWPYEPVCVNNICKWKYLGNNSEIIDNKFIENPYFPGDDL